MRYPSEDFPHSVQQTVPKYRSNCVYFSYRPPPVGYKEYLLHAFRALYFASIDFSVVGSARRGEDRRLSY